MSTSAFQNSAVTGPMLNPIGTAGDSPTSPPFSPITPVMSNEFPPPASPDQSASQAAEVPHLEPFSESDNPDAIALRSAISVLQIQRQRALQDLITLEKQKKLAVADPQAFSEALVTRKIKEESAALLSSQASFQSNLYDAQDKDDEQVESDTETRERSPQSRFGDLPGPQKVVRCPPINWAKYHVLGQPLEALHEEQRRRPDDGHHSGEANARGKERVIAAPYDPFEDRLAPKPSRSAPGNSDSLG